MLIAWEWAIDTKVNVSFSQSMGAYFSKRPSEFKLSAPPIECSDLEHQASNTTDDRGYRPLNTHLSIIPMVRIPSLLCSVLFLVHGGWSWKGAWWWITGALLRYIWNPYTDVTSKFRANLLGFLIYRPPPISQPHTPLLFSPMRVLRSPYVSFLNSLQIHKVLISLLTGSINCI